MYKQTEEFPVTNDPKVGQYHEIAEAIRRGSKMSEPRKGFPYEITPEGVCRTCLIGAYALGSGMHGDDIVEFYGNDGPNRWEIKFPILVEAEKRFEGWDEWTGNPQTREQIADWIDSL